MSVHSARSRVTQAREYLSSGRLDLVESALRTGEQYLADMTGDEAAALRGEIAALRAELANQPTDEETRCLSAARGKVRAARGRLEERQLLGIEDVLASAAKYLEPVRPLHRATVDAEIAAIQAEVTALTRPAPAPAPVPAPAPAPSVPPAPPAPAPVIAGPPPGPTEQEQRQLSAARGKLRAARSRIDERQPLGVDDMLETAANYLTSVRPEHRREADAELAALTEELAAALRAAAPVPPPAPVTPVGPSEDEQRHIAAARGKIRAARTLIADDELAGIDDVVAAAVAYLANVRHPHRAAVDDEIAILRSEIETARAPAVAPPTDEEQRYISAARGKIRAARSRIAEQQLLGIEDVVASAVNHLIAVRPEHRAAVDAELTALNSEIAAARRAAARAPAPSAAVSPAPSAAPTGPSDEEQRNLAAARNKIRAARSRIDEQQLLGIDDVIASAVSFLGTVRPEHRAAADAELAALQADLTAAQQRVAPVVRSVTTTTGPAASTAPTDEEQRNLSAARGKIRAARSRIDEQQLLGIDDVIAAAAGYLGAVRPEHRAAADAELATLQTDLAAARHSAAPVVSSGPARPTSTGPTEEEQRYISAARGKLRAARARIDEQQLLGIDDVINAAANYLGPVRSEHRAEVDAEIAALRAQLRPATAPAPTPAPVAPPKPAAPDTSGPLTPTQDELRAMTSARSMIRLARRKLDDKQLPGMDEIFGAIVKHLETVRPGQRTAVDAELAALRAEILAVPGGADALGPHAAAPATPSPASPAPTPPAAAPAPVAPVAVRPLSDDEQSSLSRARGRVISARSALEGRRFDAVEPAIEEALALLAKVPDFATQTLRGEIADLRGQLAEETRTHVRRKVLDEIERHLRNAENDADYKHFESGEESVRKALDRLAKPDARELLTAEQIGTYEHRASVLRGLFASTLHADALARVRPLIAELEEEVAGDVYQGMDGHALVRKERELGYMRMRVLGAIRYVPGNDPDVAAIVHRLVATDRRIAASATNWSKLRREVRLANDWGAILAETAGWDQEPPAPDADVARMVEPQLPRTRQVLHRTRLMLDDARKRSIAVVPDAEALFAAAATKLAAAYIRILDAAERIPTPFNTFLIRRPAQLAYNIELALAGTPHRDALVARAQQLDARWRTEVAALSKTQQELHEKLTREADAKWPLLRDSTPAVPFDPDRMQPGKLIYLEGVFNRAGWDYTGPGVEFAVRLGDYFLSGVCAPHVDAALLLAWTEDKLDVGDRVPWNVIGVVEGPGTLGVRTQLTVRDAQTSLVLGEAEAWSTQPCQRIQIIGLQAGPVLVLGEAGDLPAAAEHVDELASR